jgi:spheroidene monooxygenase
MSGFARETLPDNKAPNPALEGGAVPATAGLPSVAVLLMSRVRSAEVPWALWRLVRGPRGLGPIPGLRFARVLGSGRAEGFGVRPGLDCQGVFAGFDTLEHAQAFAQSSPVAGAYRQRAEETFAAVLQVSSSRGSWAGQGMAAGTAAPAAGLPIAALTRASIRLSKALPFWRLSPPAEAELAQAPGCQLAVGLGEAPLLRQATFSLWDSTAAMDAYARHGAHQRAIRASGEGGYFSEWMFVRFQPLWLQGQWKGQRLQLGAHG